MNSQHDADGSVNTNKSQKSLHHSLHARQKYIFLHVRT